MRTKLRSKVTLLFMTFALLLAIPAVALADDFRNDLDNSFDADFEVLGLEQDGASEDVNIVLQTQGSDGDGGCNLDGAEKVEVQAVSSDSNVASVKWVATGTDKVEFLGCNAANSRNLTVTPGSAGTANITLAITGATATTTSGVYTVSSTGSGTYDVRTAQFTADVAAPPNEAPDVSVTGVEHGAVYEHGAVPAAGCNVTDDNDPNPTTDPVKDSSGLNSYGLGSETVTCSYTDGGGLEETATATYTIVDTTAPVIAAHADVTEEATSANGAVVNYTNPTANDAVYGSVNVDCTPASGSQFPLGTTPVNCSATDGSGNTSNSTFNVLVQDTTGPVLTLPDDITAEATGPGGAAVSFTASAEDAVDGSVNVDCTPASGSTFALGTTPVNCSATDAAGNESTGTFNVLVQDTTPPALNLPADKTVEATGPNGAAVNFTASATDIVDGSITPNCSANSGDTFPLGTTEVTCSATDAAGNSSTGSFNVLVQDTTAPVIDPHADVNATATSANGAVVNYTSPSTTDAVDGNGTATCLPASGSTFAVGKTTVTCNATDAAGNPATPTTFKVNVAYSWSNFLQPINVTGTQSVFKLGSTVPVKFQLTGASAGVTNGTFYLKYIYTGAGDGTGELEATATTTGTTGTQFRYDATSGQYIFNWSTKSAPKPGNYEIRVYTDSAGTNLLGSVSIELKK